MWNAWLWGSLRYQLTLEGLDRVSLRHLGREFVPCRNSASYKGVAVCLGKGSEMLHFLIVWASCVLASGLKVEVIWWNAHMIVHNLEHQCESCCLCGLLGGPGSCYPVSLLHWWLVDSPSQSIGWLVSGCILGYRCLSRDVDPMRPCCTRAGTGSGWWRPFWGPLEVPLYEVKARVCFLGGGVSQLRSVEMVLPRYLQSFTCFRTWLLSRYR